MKKIILILLTVVAVTANAQRVETINSEILHPEKRFELLDRTEITTGNLINRALVFSDHTQFYKDSVDTNSFVGWQQLYHEIYKGYYNTATKTNPDSIIKKVKQQKKSGITPILIMDMEYQQLKLNAIVDSLIIDENGVFKDNLQRNKFIEQNFQYTEMRNTQDKGKVSDIEDVNQVISKLRDSYTTGAVESHNKSKDKLTKTIEDKLQDFFCNLDAHKTFKKS